MGILDRAFRQDRSLALKLAEDNGEILYSQASTWRWPGRRTINRQNIAEHHSVVAQLVLLIIDAYNVPEEYHLQALRRAIVHDLPEAWTNDIPYTIKRDYPEFAKAYDAVEEDIERRLPSSLVAKTKKGSIPWLVVKLADSIDVLLFSQAEIDLGTRNSDMIRIHSTCKERIMLFEDLLIEALES